MKKFLAVLMASAAIFSTAVLADPLIENPKQDHEGLPNIEPQADPKTLFIMLQCDGVNKNLIDMVTGKYEEDILAKASGLVADAQTGRFHNGQMLLTVNPDTRSWSLLGIFADGTGCMITNGRDFTPYVKPAENL